MRITFAVVACTASIFLFSSLGQAVHAQPVQVSAAEEGQGYLFSEEGICYVLTAAHVTNGARRAQIVTQSGAGGSATMVAPFWTGFDLDVGQVRRIPDTECTATFDDMLRGAAVPLSGARVVLPLIGPGGVDNLDLSVSRSDYLEFTGQFLAADAAGKKGMSGGFAFAGATPVGMARATGADGSIQFIQMAEIAMNLRRWLDRSSVAAPVTPDLAQAGQAGALYEVVSATPPAIGPDYVVEAMVQGTGPFAYPAGQNAVIVLENRMEGEKLMSRLRLQSQPTEGYSQPQQIRLDITPHSGGTAQYWRIDPFPPDGFYDTGAVARRFATSITITLIGARGNDPVRIDRIILD